MWTLHFSTHKRYSGVPQIVITQVQLCQTRELWAENFRQSFTAPQWEVTATQTKKKKIHAAFIKDNIRQYLHAVQEVKVKVVADYCDLRWNTETTKMQKHENDADLIFFSSSYWLHLSVKEMRMLIDLTWKFPLYTVGISFQ